MVHRRQTGSPSIAKRVATRPVRTLQAGWLLTLLAGCAADIPHPVSSQTDAYCRTCHVGRAGTPASHDKSGCVSCHQVDTTGPYPQLMPHPGGQPDRCRLCHADGALQAPITKHLEEADCYTCHESNEYRPWPPAVSHEVTDPGRDKCLECHKDSSHADRPSCTVCHEL